jgi:PhzF family phenazine biosynthesis protein
MAESVQFRLVDAFAETPFTGNPAGVVLDADSLDARQMQAIAREVNASETAFVSGANDLHRPPRLRWFTPSSEVEFCGHATLAAAHAWSEAVGFRALLGKSDPGIEFETTAGRLRLTPEIIAENEDRLVWWLAMPDPRLQPDNTNPMKLTALLGLTLDDLDESIPIMRTRDRDVILLVRTWRALVEMKPDFQKLRRLCVKHAIRGVCVATLDVLSDFAHVVSRFFAPAVGVPEDPVTGSVHGPLAALLTINELVPMTRTRAALNCLQGPPGGRTGVVRALVEPGAAGYRVSVGGMTHTTVRGEMRVPAPTESFTPRPGPH